MTNFPERVKVLRLRHELTQKQISDIIGVRQSTYSGYENGTYQPQLNILIKLATLFEVSIDFLVGFALPLVANEEERAILYARAKKTGKGIARTTGEAVKDGYSVGYNKARGRDTAHITDKYKPPMNEDRLLTAGADEPPPTE
jgi:transcriptional regulator with XRE-family HTH domain